MVAATREESLELATLVIEELSLSMSLKTYSKFLVVLEASSEIERFVRGFSTTGGSSTAVTVTLTVMVSLCSPSETWTTKVSEPLKLGSGE